MKYDNKISLDEKGEETFEYEFIEEYDMYTFVYGTKDQDSEDPIAIKTELGGLEAKAIMEAMIHHITTSEGLGSEDFIERYLTQNKFRGTYEQ